MRSSEQERVYVLFFLPFKHSRGDAQFPIMAEHNGPHPPRPGVGIEYVICQAGSWFHAVVFVVFHLGQKKREDGLHVGIECLNKVVVVFF